MERDTDDGGRKYYYYTTGHTTHAVVVVVEPIKSKAISVDGALCGVYVVIILLY